MTQELNEEIKQNLISVLMNNTKDETTPTNPDSVDIIYAEDCGTEDYPNNDCAYLVTVDLHYPEDTYRIPVIYYPATEIVFLPCDWQGWLPDTPEDIERIDWYLIGTEVKAINFNGLPCVPFGVAI